jgi:hypothetical protein
MDPKNTFETPVTYAAVRAEYGVLAAMVGLLLWRNRCHVRWSAAAGLFLYPDIAGYLPGAVAYRRRVGHAIPRGYYVAYNVMHSALTGALIAALWARFVRLEWALLGIPLHIGLDRGLFGNSLKPFSVSFEPLPHPVWEGVKRDLRSPWRDNLSAA